MRTTAEKTIDRILKEQDPQSTLGRIQKKVCELQRISQLWKNILSPELSQHSRIANFHHHSLIVEVNSAAWAIHLRYLAADLVQQLSNHDGLQSLTHIEWKIQPAFHTQTQPASPRSRACLLSQSSATLLRNTAMALQAKPLQDALMKLAHPP